MYCTRCGTSADNKQFCTQCGFELKKSANQAAHVVSSSSDKTLKQIHQKTIVNDQNAVAEQSSEMSNPKATHTTRKGSALALLTVSLILLLSVAAEFGPSRYFDHDRNRQQSTAPVITKTDDQAAAPQLKTTLPTNPTPDAPGEKPTPNIETKPSMPGSDQPVGKYTVETQKRVGAILKAAPKIEVIPDRESYGLNRVRPMIFDDYSRYRRYRYYSYGPYYRDRLYQRRRFRWNYR